MKERRGRKSKRGIFRVFFSSLLSAAAVCLLAFASSTRLFFYPIPGTTKRTQLRHLSWNRGPARRALAIRRSVEARLESSRKAPATSPFSKRGKNSIALVSFSFFKNFFFAFSSSSSVLNKQLTRPDQLLADEDGELFRHRRCVCGGGVLWERIVCKKERKRERRRERGEQER